jgi:hypothetical protein
MSAQDGLKLDITKGINNKMVGPGFFERESKDETESLNQTTTRVEAEYLKRRRQAKKSPITSAEVSHWLHQLKQELVLDQSPISNAVFHSVRVFLKIACEQKENGPSDFNADLYQLLSRFTSSHWFNPLDERKKKFFTSQLDEYARLAEASTAGRKLEGMTP